MVLFELVISAKLSFGSDICFVVNGTFEMSNDNDGFGYFDVLNAIDAIFRPEIEEFGVNIFYSCFRRHVDLL